MCYAKKNQYHWFTKTFSIKLSLYQTVFKYRKLFSIVCYEALFIQFTIYSFILFIHLIVDDDLLQTVQEHQKRRMDVVESW